MPQSGWDETAIGVNRMAIGLPSFLPRQAHSHRTRLSYDRRRLLIVAALELPVLLGAEGDRKGPALQALELALDLKTRSGLIAARRLFI